jgi:RND family efflux transporter MFP subunit
MPALFRRPIFWIVIVLVLAGAGACVFMGKQAAAKKAADQKAAIATLASTPYAGIASGKADVEGGIIQVAARTAGVIRSVDVQEGDSVKKGQILAQLEDDQPRLNVANAEAAVHQAQAQVGLLEVQKETAQREYARLIPLKAKNFVAGQSLDNAQDAIKTADAQIALQRAVIGTAQSALNVASYQLELTRVRAPTDGRIVRRYANPGAGASTLNVSNMFDLEPRTARIVRAEIAESDIPKITIGQQAEIVPEADQTKVYVGKVMRRSDEFGARKLQSDDPNDKADDRVVEVVVSADTAPLLIGQRVLVKFMKPGQIAGAPHPMPKSSTPTKAA